MEARQPRPELEVVVEEGRVGVAEAPCPGVLEPDIDHLVAQLLLGPRVHLEVGLEHKAALLLGDESPHPHLPVVLRRAALPVLAGDALVALVVVSIPLLLEPVEPVLRLLLLVGLLLSCSHLAQLPWLKDIVIVAFFCKKK